MYHLPMSDNLIAHYAGFTIKVALTSHRSGNRWTSSFTLIPGEGGEITYGPYYASTLFATREEAKQAALDRARIEIDK